MTQRRAKVGGERGANGEWYEGGKFIATTDHAKTLGSTPKGSGKVEYEPYKFAFPAPGMRPIFRFGGTYLWLQKGVVMREFCVNMHRHDDIPSFEELLRRWQAGERWYSTEEFPNL